MSDNEINVKTVIIAVVISVILSVVISYMILPAGPQGAQGLQGIQGVKGDTGNIGPAGPGLGELIYDSGWTLIDNYEDKVFCTLDNPNVFVYMIGRRDYYTASQTYFGGASEGTLARGARWYITTNNELTVYRFADDEHWPLIRVMVWQLP